MKLKDLAIKMASIYQQNSKVKAVLLAGSVSRGWEDKHSDIELNIFWSAEPTEADRMKPIQDINGSVIDFHPFEEEEWAESYLTPENVKLEISSFLVETAEKWLDEVVKEFEIDYGKQCMASSVFYGQSLYGEQIINELKKKVKIYPDALAEKMMEENLALWYRWNNRNALLDRKDWLMLYDLIGSVQRKLMGTLFGLNKLYIHHPSFKWMHQYSELFNIKPENLDERFTEILIGDVNNSVQKLELLIKDVFALVEEHYPHLEFLESYKEKMAFIRPERV
jgi:predicted nucleotidyltransferase